MKNNTNPYTKIFTLWLLSLPILLGACGKSPYPVTDHYDGDLFFNPDSTYRGKTFWDVMKWRWSGPAKPKWDFRHTPVFDTLQWAHNPKDSMGKSANYRSTWINHSTFALQFDSLLVLTDPVWSERVSPVSFAGPKRYHPPAIPIDKLGRVDVIVLSHNHYDHLDLESLEKLRDLYDPLIIVPLGNERLLKAEGHQKVFALDWYEHKVFKGLKITLTPARHWSARGLFDRFENLWGGYFFESTQRKVFFAGDTGYGPHFGEIKDRLGSPDLALIPTGAFMPEWFMNANHMGPKELIPAINDLDAKLTLTMHTSTFALGDDGQDQPRQVLDSILKVTQNPPDIKQPLPGDFYDF